MPCNLEYIPPRLHQNDRPTLDSFYIEEEIYRRSKIDEIDCPFATISLTDISVNRQGNPQSPISNPDDVLFNITGEGDIPKYRQGYVVLRVKELLPNSTFYKKLVGLNQIGDTVVLELILKHAPIPCNYAHSVFELTYNGVTVTAENYKQTLKKNKELRNNCRLIIQQMIIRKEIRIDSN